MGTSCGRLRTLVVAVLSGIGVAAVGIAQAHALSPGPAGGADVHFALGSGAPLTVQVALRQPARTVSVRLGSAGWVPCGVHGLRASCPVAPGAVDLARLGRVDVLATR